VAGRDVPHLEGVLECRHSLRNGVIRRDDEMEPAGDQVDFGIDLCEYRVFSINKSLRPLKLVNPGDLIY